MKPSKITKNWIIKEKLRQSYTPEEIHKFLMIFEQGKFKTSLKNIIEQKNEIK